jgi:hypothetical protein
MHTCGNSNSSCCFQMSQEAVADMGAQFHTIHMPRQYPCTRLLAMLSAALRRSLEIESSQQAQRDLKR